MSIEIWIALYLIVHVISFLVVRFYWLKDVFATKDDKELIKKYPLFQRRDLDIGLLRSLPWYLTYWPRIISCYFGIFFGAFICVILTIGVKDTSKMSGKRYKVMKFII
jgi:hypothetical protein